MCRASVECLEWEKNQAKSWEEVQREEFSNSIMHDMEEEDVPPNVIIVPIEEFMRRLAVISTMTEEEQLAQIQEFYDRLRN